MKLKRVTFLSLTLSLLFHFLFLIYSPRIVVGGREKLRNMTERILQVKLSSSSTLFSQDIKEKPLPVDKGVEVSFKPLDWQRKEFLSLPEPRTPMSEILPPPEKKFSQEVIALSSKLLEEKIVLKPRRYISKEEGNTPFSDIGVKLPGEDGEKRFTLKEKIQRKIDLEKEIPVTSLPPSSPLSLPSLPLPVEKVSSYAFWDDLLNVKFFIWSPPKQSKYLKVEIGLKPGVK
ncbi:hypothetical protein J7K43_02205, partial [Candidatus Calescamantes bacterium]|nr:hypothetical protein [Candidatus Calescamantes bacterium]